jgi:hypothetical protein
VGGGDGEDAKSFADFVTRRQQSLLCLAFLLATASAPTAEHGPASRQGEQP